MFHDMQKVGLIDRVESFRNIQLNEQRRHFPFMKILDHFVNIHEIIMYTSIFYESCLVN
jgi:hypothetical protein